MTTAIILAGGTGVRMKTNGLPKQFLPLYGKPIICYTLEVFIQCDQVDQIIIPCNPDWIEYMNKLLVKQNFQKPILVISGGQNRQESIVNGLTAINAPLKDDIVIIHDGVRPLVSEKTIIENIKTTKKSGNAMTVKQNTETVVVTSQETAVLSDFKNRENTFTLTSPQTFRVKELISAYQQAAQLQSEKFPILDAALLYAKLGTPIYLVKETGLNLKITTPEDFYYLRAYLELSENKEILGV